MMEKVYPFGDLNMKLDLMWKSILGVENIDLFSDFTQENAAASGVKEFLGYWLKMVEKSM